MSYEFGVLGMMCQGCANNVKKAVSAIDGVTSVEVDLESKRVKVESTKEISDQAFADAVKKAGYTYFK
jgi:copper chaperone CopZ